MIFLRSVSFPSVAILKLKGIINFISSKSPRRVSSTRWFPTVPIKRKFWENGSFFMV
jgi:hypothetical protein